MSNAVKDNAARSAQDAGTHGYHGRHAASDLLRLCARAVRAGARRVESTYSVAAVSADERAEYVNELAARLVAENGGELPDTETVAYGYLIRRAQGLIMNDRARYALDVDGPGAGEAGADTRLDGPLSIPADVEAVADVLGLGETAKRALCAAMVPATRAEWADFYGYSSPDSWRIMARRGRAELVAIGPDAIRQALAKVESDHADQIEAERFDISALIEEGR